MKPHSTLRKTRTSLLGFESTFIFSQLRICQVPSMGWHKGPCCRYNNREQTHSLLSRCLQSHGMVCTKLNIIRQRSYQRQVGQFWNSWSQSERTAQTSWERESRLSPEWWVGGFRWRVATKDYSQQREQNGWVFRWQRTNMTRAECAEGKRSYLSSSLPWKESILSGPAVCGSVVAATESLSTNGSLFIKSTFI